MKDTKRLQHNVCDQLAYVVASKITFNVEYARSIKIKLNMMLHEPKFQLINVFSYVIETVVRMIGFRLTQIPYYAYAVT